MYAYTVIYIHTDNGQICADHVQAENAMAAFTVVAKENSGGIEFVVTIEGHLFEDDQLIFPGDGVVSDETVLSQPEIFS